MKTAAARRANKAAKIELIPGDLLEIDSAVSKTRIQGDRYFENLEQLTNG